jgi:DNA (cytosine-5)-methyltransferase 1
MDEWKRMNKWAYYNEIDPYCVAWLKNLMDAGEIPRGVIDTRSIEDVTPNDLYGFRQCHFFAGLGGWAYALDLAGWPRDRPVWTGSCPCQPFSAAGKGTGFADERHLWPAWQHLIAQCRPGIIFGEQVASKAADAWIDLVHADMEGMGYAFGCIPFPSAGVGAPHVRERTYWVADADDTRLEGRFALRERADELAAGPRRLAGGLADATRGGWREERADHGRGSCGDSAQGITAGLVHGGGDLRPGPTNGQWADADWLGCTDGKWRPVEPGSQPLAHGVPNRVGRLRAYGNAINPHQAAEFVAAYAEAKGLMGLERAA